MHLPRILIAGLRGGSGKTLVAAGLQAALRGRGLAVAPFKKGPDYIDAAWSAAAAGRPCRNLDLFLSAPEAILRSFAAGAAGADLSVIEGNRGLFDGVDAAGTSSTAELAKALSCPVVLVVDCTKATRTAAAAVLGCLHLDPAVPLRGVVLNRTAGERHESVVRAAIAASTGLPVLGSFPRLPGDVLPERHMGLVPPAEHAGREGALREAAEAAARFLDLDALLAMARAAPPLDIPAAPPAPPRGPAPAGVRIGVLRDEAFQFYYPENLEALEREGAALVDVSPLRDRGLPDVDALYAGGGFPETLAGGLAANAPFRASLLRAVESGLPVYAECGGAVYLGSSLRYGGREHPMAGVLPLSFDFQERPRGHGYSVLETTGENPFFAVGTTLRGHEFHHTHPEAGPREGLRFAFRVERGVGFGDGRDGLCVRNVLATYTHLHALSAPGWAPGLAAAARRFREAVPARVAAAGEGVR